MCSIGEDDFGDEGGVHSMVANIKHENNSYALDKNICNKCKNLGAIYKLPFREAECRKCFLHYARHKFRAALGSSKILPKDANVLLVFDGSAQSLVLLDMLHHAQKQSAFKRLHCNVTVIYLDDSQQTNDDEVNTSGSKRQLLARVENILGKYDGFNSFVIPFVVKEKAENFISSINPLSENYFSQTLKSEKQAFFSFIESIKTLTSRQDYMKLHRKKLIAIAAKHFQCNFAFMSDISSDLATELLSAVALGRGGSAALDVALVDDRLDDGLLLCRPLRDLSGTEIEFYIKAQELEMLVFKLYADSACSSGSLQNITKAFILNLQENFSSTVSTVFRTGSKITTNLNVSAKLNDLQIDDFDVTSPGRMHCSFCNSDLDYRNSATLLATEFSRVVSENGSTIAQCDDLSTRAEKSLQGVNEKQCFQNLCHACHNIFSDT